MTERDKERVNQWRREHPEKVREYNRNRLRRKYLADFLQECEKSGKIGKNCKDDAGDV